MWYESMIRFCWWALAINIFAAILNFVIGYSNYISQSYWLAGFNCGIGLMSSYVAWIQWTNIAKYKQQLKDLVWETLKKPSDAI